MSTMGEFSWRRSPLSFLPPPPPHTHMHQLPAPSTHLAELLSTPGLSNFPESEHTIFLNKLTSVPSCDPETPFI